MMKYLQVRAINIPYKLEFGGVVTLNLDDIIEYDEESTNLDFKKEEYHKNDYVSLIKDISSMANALNSEIKKNCNWNKT